jgi:hypothetical protein
VGGSVSVGVVTVVTAVYGAYDRLRVPAAQDVPARWVVVTDDRHLRAPAPWEVLVRPAEFPDPRLSSKVPKMTPGLFGTDDVVWVDANMQVTSGAFTRQALAARRCGVATFAHPRRDDITAEARASLGVESQGGKYAGQPLLEQVAGYTAAGHPRRGGLYATGVVAWHAPTAWCVGEAWLAECVRWSTQDQLSLPVVCARAGVTPGVFGFSQTEIRGRGWVGNRWLRIHPHRPR